MSANTLLPWREPHLEHLLPSKMFKTQGALRFFGNFDVLSVGSVSCTFCFSNFSVFSKRCSKYMSGGIHVFQGYVGSAEPTCLLFAQWHCDTVIGWPMLFDHNPLRAH